MANSIFDLINAQTVGAFVTNAPSNAIPYLGETLFPAVKQLGLDIKYFKAANGLPIALTPSAFDAKATMRDRVGLASLQAEMPFFREGAKVGEKDRQELNKLLASNQYQQYLNPILNNIFNDQAKLVEGARVQAERMRMQLLSGGKIAVKANDVAYDYDYQFNANNKVTLTTAAANGFGVKWSTVATADPIADISAACDKVEELTGNRPNQAVCNSATFKYLMDNAKIIGYLKAGLINSNAGLYVTEPLVKNLVEQLTGVQIAIYNKKYSLDKVATKYFPDNVFTLIPAGNLGNTYYGTTPEESDLMAGNTDGQVTIVNTGVAVTTYAEKHPVNVVTIVSAIMLPSFEQADNCFIMTVA